MQLYNSCFLRTITSPARFKFVIRDHFSSGNHPRATSTVSFGKYHSYSTVRAKSIPQGSHLDPLLFLVMLMSVTCTYTHWFVFFGKYHVPAHNNELAFAVNLMAVAAWEITCRYYPVDTSAVVNIQVAALSHGYLVHQHENPILCARLLRGCVLYILCVTRGQVHF